ncbi:MAG: carotenoid oxygenase family protein [Cyanobacteria bacterium P01_H01_bin.15]
MTSVVQPPLTDDKPYDRADWQRGYLSQPQEFDYWVEEIDGTIPAELNGTLFRNGPGLMDINGMTIHHPFDGDGMINRFTFQNGRVHYRNRYVQTEGYMAEQAAGKILYRGVFGTQKPGGWWNNFLDFNLKNIANTNIIYWGEKLLALWEGAKPHQLDPVTLSTFGIDDLSGDLGEKDNFAAHPRFEAGAEPRLINFSIDPGLSSELSVFEFDQTGKLLTRYGHRMPGFAFIHDFVVTPQYAIFFQNPVDFNPFPFLVGFRGAGECIKFQPQQATKIILIPRNGDREQIKIFESQAGFVFHHANAFETEGKVVIDSICYESFPEIEPGSDFRNVDFDGIAPGNLWRFELDLASETVSRSQLDTRCCEFPTLNQANAGRAYRYLYAAAAHEATGNAPHQAYVKLNLETGDRKLCSFAPRGYVSEPIFVPHPNAESEDHGWVLGVVYRSDRHASDLVILSAQTWEVVATVKLKEHIPYSLHGSWVPETFLHESVTA